MYEDAFSTLDAPAFQGLWGKAKLLKSTPTRQQHCPE